MKWMIVLLTFLLCHLTLINSILSPEEYDFYYDPKTKNKEVREKRSTNDEKKAKNLIDQFQNTGNKKKREIASTGDENFDKTQEYFNKLSLDKKFEFMRKNVHEIEHIIDESKLINQVGHSKIRSNRLDEQKINREKEINSVSNFMSFLLFIGLICCFIYCIYLMLIGCMTVPPQQSTTHILHDSTVTRGPTTIYPVPPPTYTSILNNPPNKD